MQAEKSDGIQRKHLRIQATSSQIRCSKTQAVQSDEIKFIYSKIQAAKSDKI